MCKQGLRRHYWGPNILRKASDSRNIHFSSNCCNAARKADEHHAALGRFCCIHVRICMGLFFQLKFWAGNDVGRNPWSAFARLQVGLQAGQEVCPIPACLFICLINLGEPISVKSSLVPFWTGVSCQVTLVPAHCATGLRL